ncbi:MoaD/ThiS family protein [uncultured Acinetobacter sp.]|uniref:MoaD/ThiS family protein n=1 Tax=uncultured Acinetobacter sp. TaxID=165433 RepID=UPI003748F101
MLEKLAGTVEYSLEFETSVAIAQSLTLLAIFKPEIAVQPERCACAIDDMTVSRSAIISENIVIALLPPVAGG